MYKLPENWLTEGLMDTEYKQYLLLAYLRDIHQVFENKILYPPFSELIQHHQYLLKVKSNFDTIKSSQRILKGIDWKNMKLLYESKENSLDENNETIEFIEKILDFSIPKVEAEIRHGKKVFDDVEQHLRYTGVGLLPLLKNVGYFLVQEYPHSNFWAYKYEVTSIYVQGDEGQIPYKYMKTEYVSTYTLTISSSLSSIKHELIKENPDLPNPAVYGFFPHTTASMEYTIVPVIKRVLMQVIS